MSPIPDGAERIAIFRLPDLDPVTTLTGDPTVDSLHKVACRLEKNGTGTGQFSITLDDAAHALIEINDVAAIRRDGVTVAALLIEQISENTLSNENGSEENATYIGRLMGACLEWAVIAPAHGDDFQPVEEDAVLDWRSWRYDPADDAWAPANEIMTVAAAEAGAWPHQPMAAQFDLTTGATMILASGADGDYASTGWFLFRKVITIPVGGRHGIELLMDDLGAFWVDAIQQLDVSPTEGFITASFKRLELSTGDHVFTWAVFNFEDPENPGFGLGPAAMAYNLYKADLQDRPLAGGFYDVSDSSVDVLYVDEDPFPGMTVGEDLLDLIGEAQTRGAIPWVDPSFTKLLDSNGDAFAREVGLTTKTGTTTILAFLDELVASGRISRWCYRPDGVTLDVFAPGYTTRPTPTGYPTGIELDPADPDDPTTGQVVELGRVIT